MYSLSSDITGYVGACLPCADGYYQVHFCYKLILFLFIIITIHVSCFVGQTLQLSTACIPCPSGYRSSLSRTSCMFWLYRVLVNSTCVGMAIGDSDDQATRAQL